MFIGISFCFGSFQFVLWRKNAVARLESLQKKRPLSTDTTTHMEKRAVRDQADDLLHDHCYATLPVAERSNIVRQEIKNRQLTPVSEDSNLSYSKGSQENALLHNRETVTMQILCEIGQQVDSLCTTEEYGTVLGMDVNDSKMSNIAEYAIEEMRKRIPMLYKVLVAASTSSGVKTDWFLFAIYAMLMRNRSQRFNTFQRLMTASCIRYHAGNEVTFHLYQFPILFVKDLNFNNLTHLHSYNKNAYLFLFLKNGTWHFKQHPVVTW